MARIMTLGMDPKARASNKNSIRGASPLKEALAFLPLRQKPDSRNQWLLMEIHQALAALLQQAQAVSCISQFFSCSLLFLLLSIRNHMSDLLRLHNWELTRWSK